MPIQNGYYYLGGISGFANSTFFTSFIGALAGAWGGQWIVERSKRREYLVSQIRNVNAAITTTFHIFNSHINLKKQVVQETCERFDSEKNRYLDVLKGSANFFDLSVDFNRIPPPVLHIETLKQLMFHQVSIVGRPLLLTSQLIDSCHQLSNVLVNRNIYIDLFYKEKQKITPEQYFGLRQSGYRSDETYSSYISAIKGYTDDCIFFSQLLCEDLIKYGEST